MTKKDKVLKDRAPYLEPHDITRYSLGQGICDDLLDFMDRERRQYPNFDDCNLSQKFIEAFESQKRIRVKFECGTIKSGTVGVTAGCKPCFMLMLTFRDLSSLWLLNDKCEII